MDTDLYTKSVEQLMVERELSVSCVRGSKFGGLRFKAYSTGTASGEGDSPREAIIDYYKKLNKH
jgi:hypothetical protein